MSKESMSELLQFLQPECRIDLKHIALEHLVGLTSNEKGIDLILKNEDLLRRIIDITNDNVEELARNALLLLVNLTANVKGASELLKLQPTSKKSVLDIFVGYVLNSHKSDADAACMILSNITRVEENIEECVDAIITHLDDILNVFVNTEFNKKGSKLDYLAPVFSNLSCSPRVRKWLIEKEPHAPLTKLLPFCSYEKSSIRRGGAMGTIRNISFDVLYHSFLLSSDLDLLTHLLGPLMGNEDYPDEEMEMLPISLQYLPKEKQRESDIDIRKMILETLNKLCSIRPCREILRENGVYYILREYHKWEKEPKVLLACENVIDILIQKEEEVGVEDLSSVEVPEDMVHKFEKMDENYLNNI